MDTFDRYKRLKLRLQNGNINNILLNSIGIPILWYNGQYQLGKDNVSILAPVIYIEMPTDMKIDYFPRGLQTVRNAHIKIHILSIAPYKSIDNQIQDHKIEQHQTLIDDVHNLLNGFEMKTDAGKVITSQLILQGIAPMKYRSSFVVTVLDYVCEFYKQELKSV
ncbi:MAG: hypothetical protein RJA25_420 [Bacteroidota bacterium]|jgi:hypothetical protein